MINNNLQIANKCKLGSVYNVSLIGMIVIIIFGYLEINSEYSCFKKIITVYKMTDKEMMLDDFIKTENFDNEVAIVSRLISNNNIKISGINRKLYCFYDEIDNLNDEIDKTIDNVMILLTKTNNHEVSERVKSIRELLANCDKLKSAYNTDLKSFMSNFLEAYNLGKEEATTEKINVIFGLNNHAKNYLSSINQKLNSLSSTVNSEQKYKKFKFCC